MFVADDLGAWLISALADAGRRKLTAMVLGSEQERALRSTAAAAVQLTAVELRPGDAEQAEQLATVVSQVFSEPVPGAPLAGDATVLEALQAAIAGQLAVLDAASLTGTGQSSADVLGVPGTVVAAKLTGYLLREIVVRGSRGGPLFPLASQLNDDVTHLQGQRMEAAVDQLASEVRQAVARMGGAHAMAVAPTALAQLPAATAGFTGRGGELAVLAGMLDPARSSGPVSAVGGLAGVGKTTLAVQAGHAALQRGWFGGGVIFIDLHGYDEVPVKPAQALDALLRALGVLVEHIPPSMDERAGLYRSVLAQISEPVLVIADNTATEAQVKPLLPGAGPHKVITTSRHTLAGLGARLVDVTVLDGKDAIALIHEALRTARPDDDRITCDNKAATRLVRLCGGLPLALQISAALLKAQPTLTAGELADELDVENDRLERLAYDDGSNEAGSSVAAAFWLSYHRLDETAARVFRLLPVSPGPDVSTEVVAVLADLPVSKVSRILAGLAAAHLIERAARPKGRWRIHDLLRLYAQQRSEEHGGADAREQARDRLLSHYLDTTRAAADHLQALPRTDVSDAFTGQETALAWLDAEWASLLAAIAMAAATGRDQVAVRLPLLLGGYISRRRRFDDQITIITVSLAIAQRHGDRTSEGAALTNLGSALCEVRRFGEAVTAHQNAIVIFRETGNRRGEGAALNGLGNALRGVRRFEEAITAHQGAIAIFRETGNRRGEGGALNNLANTLQKLRRFEEAITAFQEDLAICCETGDRHGEGTTLDNLANTLQEMRRFEEAVAAHQNAIAIFREAGDRYGEGRALTHLGLAMRETEQFTEAISTCQEAVAIFRETGDRHGEGVALGNLGTALHAVQRFEEATLAYQEAIAITRETGDLHGEGLVLRNLGGTFCGVGQFGEAITACQNAAVIHRETDDSHGEASALGNLSIAFKGVGRFEEAISACQDAIAIFRETGDRHSEGTQLHNLGSTLTEMCRVEESITAYRHAAALYHDTRDRHGEGLALEGLGQALHDADRFDESMTAYQNAITIYRETNDQHRESIVERYLERARAARHP